MRRTESRSTTATISPALDQWTNVMGMGLLIALLTLAPREASAQGLPRNWVNVGGGLEADGVTAMAVRETPGGGHLLYLTGPYFTSDSNQLNASTVAQWNGVIWSPITTGLGPICCGSFGGDGAEVLDLGDGLGPALYFYASNLPGPNSSVPGPVYRWNGSAFQSLPGLNQIHSIDVFTTFDFGDGLGEVLVAGGGNVIEPRVFRRNGGTWQQVGTNMDDVESGGGSGVPVKALTAYNGELWLGGGPLGIVETADPNDPLRLAKYDVGSGTWVAPPGGLEVPFGSSVVAMTIYQGDLVVAAGQFEMNDQPIPNAGLMRWNGATWTNMGLTGVTSLAVGNEGFLYAGGYFTNLQPCCPRVARWDGSSWTGLGADTDPDGDVTDIETVGEGDCAIIYAAGGFQETIAKYTPEPIITQHPQSQVRCLGQAATFSVTTLGGSLTFQWFKDGNPINGANGPVFTIPAVAAGDTAVYTVTVSNPCGTTVSFPATLQVSMPVVINTQPVGQTGCAGTTVVLTVVASGSPTLTYQWHKDSDPISGATSPNYVISNIQTVHVGAYHVLVSNPCGSVPSQTVQVNLACTGDVNLDGYINGCDIQPFTRLLVNPDPSAPGFCQADINQNGAVNNLDVAPFIVKLLQPPPCP